MDGFNPLSYIGNAFVFDGQPPPYDHDQEGQYGPPDPDPPEPHEQANGILPGPQRQEGGDTQSNSWFLPQTAAPRNGLTISASQQVSIDGINRNVSATQGSWSYDSEGSLRVPTSQGTTLPTNTTDPTEYSLARSYESFRLGGGNGSNCPDSHSRPVEQQHSQPAQAFTAQENIQRDSNGVGSNFVNETGLKSSGGYPMRLEGLGGNSTAPAPAGTFVNQLGSRPESIPFNHQMRMGVSDNPAFIDPGDLLLGQPNDRIANQSEPGAFLYSPTQIGVRDNLAFLNTLMLPNQSIDQFDYGQPPPQQETSSAQNSSGNSRGPDYSKMCPGKSGKRGRGRSVQKDEEHVCPRCGTGFTKKQDLKRHLLERNPARWYICPICKHEFPRNDKTLEHIRRHYPKGTAEADIEKPEERENVQIYPGTCDHCGCPFNAWSEWFNHWYQCHPEIVTQKTTPSNTQANTGMATNRAPRRHRYK